MTDNSTPDEGQGNRGRDGYNSDRRPPRRDGAPGGRGPRRDDDRRGPRRDDDRRGPRQGGERRSWGDRDERPRRDDERRGPRQGGERKPWDNRGPGRGTQGSDGERRTWGDRREGPRPERREGGGPRRGDDRRGPRRDDDRRGPRRDDRGERRSFGDRDDRRGPRRDDRGGRWEEREERFRPPGTAPRPDEPETPAEWDDKEIHPGVKAELKGLPKDLADTVAAHIWAAGQLIDEDPALAFRHAEAARRRAGRLPIVREAAAETAYAAGEFAVALREFRAIRRMSGGDELIPLIADCERALGRHRDALEVLNELNPRHPDVNLHIECLLVEAGIRDDLGQRDEALRLLKSAVSRKVGPPQGQARLQYALANLLEETGDLAGAHRWFSSAGSLDRFGDLDTADRLAALDGVTLPEDFSDDEEDLDEAPDADEAGDEEAVEAVTTSDQPQDEPSEGPGPGDEQAPDTVEEPTKEEDDR